MHKFLIFFYLTLITISLSCEEMEDTPRPESTPNFYLKKSTYIDELQKGELILIAQNTGFGEFIDLIEYDVSVYIVEYDVFLNDETIRASGVIVVPQKSRKKLPLLVANHGTITSHENAPSKTPTSNELVLMAAAGYYTFIPDYIGFGSSEEYLHPYYISTYTSQTIIDGVFAAEEFADDNNIRLNGKNLFFGYSEGGYTTMCTLKSIEEGNVLPVAASAAGAGGYNLENVMDIILSEDTYFAPSFLAYVIYSYYTYYDLDVDLTYFFKEPYASNIPTLFNGSFTQFEINSSLTFSLSNLFAEEFLNSLKNKTETVFTPLLRENSVDDWFPLNPLQLYHGTTDLIVPFLDSETTINKMTFKNGVNVEFYSIPNKGHGNALPEMVKGIIPWFEAFNVEF